MVEETLKHELTVSVSPATDNGSGALALPNDPERRLKILQAAQALRESREQTGESAIDPAVVRQRIRAAIAKELGPLEEQLAFHKRIRDAAEAKVTELERLKSQIGSQPISDLLAATESTQGEQG